MIEIFESVLSLFVSLIDLILSPIDSLIIGVLPSFSDISTNINNLFNYFYDTFVFIVQWIHIPSSVINLIIAYITFKVILFTSSLTIKLFIRWYSVLKG